MEPFKLEEGGENHRVHGKKVSQKSPALQSNSAHDGGQALRTASAPRKKTAWEPRPAGSRAPAGEEIVEGLPRLPKDRPRPGCDQKLPSLLKEARAESENREKELGRRPLAQRPSPIETYPLHNPARRQVGGGVGKALAGGFPLKRS